MLWLAYFLLKVIDKVSSKFDLRSKEPLHINRRKWTLNAQQMIWLSPFHYSLRHSFVFFYLCVFLLCFAFFFHQLFSLFLTVISDIFYCLNCISIFFHHVISDLSLHLFLLSIIFIIFKLIIGIFYCLTCTHYYFISLYHTL